MNQSHPLQRRQQSGFTLTEIMVVAVILGILAALMVPQVMSRPDQAKTTVTKGDTRTITAALNMYKLNNFAYPSTQQGLKALVKKPIDNLQPKNWNEDGYLKKLSVSPRGNPYQHLAPGTKDPFNPYSLDTDDREGSNDSNAKVGNQDN